MGNATFDKKQTKRVGKTGYMAPEVFAKKPYDPRAADIWSMGIMLFMMLIGAPPFPMPSPTNPAFNFVVNGRLKDVLKHWKRLRLVNEEALDLLNQIFVYESKRIKMDEILKHPFVNLVDNKKDQKQKPNTAQKVETKQKERETTTTTTTEQQQPEQQQTPNNEAPPVQQQTTKTIEIKDIRSHTFKSEKAQSFADRLKADSLPIEQLKAIMEEVEKAHSPLNKQSKDNMSDEGVELKSEIEAIHRYLEKQMAAQQSEPEQEKQQKHKG